MTSATRQARWVALGESEMQEFKRSTVNLEHSTETLCGMLNRQGGRVLYGVRSTERRCRRRGDSN